MGQCLKKSAEISVDTVGTITNMLQSDEGKAAIEIAALLVEKRKYRASSQRIIDNLAAKVVDIKHAKDHSTAVNGGVPPQESIPEEDEVIPTEHKEH